MILHSIKAPEMSVILFFPGSLIVFEVDFSSKPYCKF